MAAQQWESAPPMQIDVGRTYTAILHTSKGDITVKLLPEDAPLAVNNFVFLAQQGFYDGVVFHRTIRGFMIQTGDPTGTGRGGPGYTFRDETVKREYTAGTVAMANAGPNTNGSQFFVVHGQNVGLPPNYTIFGQVESGMEVVDAIASAPTERSAGGEQSKPIEPVRVESIEVLETPGVGA